MEPGEGAVAWQKLGKRPPRYKDYIAENLIWGTHRQQGDIINFLFIFYLKKVD
jgi:hypothetical protein